VEEKARGSCWVESATPSASERDLPPWPGADSQNCTEQRAMIGTTSLVLRRIPLLHDALAVDDISFAVPPGQVVDLIGPNDASFEAPAGAGSVPDLGLPKERVAVRVTGGRHHLEVVRQQLSNGPRHGCCKVP